MPRNKRRDPIPEQFDNIEQAAKFWDTHDLTDYEDVWRPAEFKVNLKRQPRFQVSLEPKIANEFARRARVKKVRVETLVNRALKEYLNRAA